MNHGSLPTHFSRGWGRGQRRRNELYSKEIKGQDSCHIEHQHNLRGRTHLEVLRLSYPILGRLCSLVWQAFSG